MRLHYLIGKRFWLSRVQKYTQRLHDQILWEVRRDFLEPEFPLELQSQPKAVAQWGATSMQMRNSLGRAGGALATRQPRKTEQADSTVNAFHPVANSCAYSEQSESIINDSLAPKINYSCSTPTTRPTFKTLSLPAWPAARVVNEAVFSYNLRHLDRFLDPDSSCWPDIHACVLRFLRHQFSEYDDRLRDRLSYDPSYRDELAAEVARAAHQKYPWLRLDIDPRPFPKTEGNELVFDQIAKSLADHHTHADHVMLAIRDLRRSPGDHRQEIKLLTQMLNIIRETIETEFGFFRTPPKDDGAHLALFEIRPEGSRGYNYGGNSLRENHTLYAGFKCPFCGVATMRTKRAVPFGQGRRMLAFSCHCMSYAAPTPPPGYAHKPITIVRWQELHSTRHAANRTAKPHGNC
jgi:hypothetical protein